MPKRHRQPEPIDISSAAHHSHHAAASSHRSTFPQSGNASSATAAAKKPVYSPGEQKLVEETRKRAMDFPATPETLARHRRHQEADAKRRRVSYDRDGQPLTEAVASANGRPSTLSSAHRMAAASTSGVFDSASRGEASEDEDVDSDLSSHDYVGDDGNQPSTDSAPDSATEEDASELRGLRKAMAAAAAQRRRAGAAAEAEAEEGSRSGESSSGEDDEMESSSLEEVVDSSDLDDVSEDDEEGSGGEAEEEDDDDDDTSGAAQQRDSDADEEEEEDVGDNDGLITVDFGVFDMEMANIDGLIHLMDQLCPDKVNEVDRDELGLALCESPFTSVVRLQNNGEDATGEEDQEFYGLSSLLDVAHGQQLYPKALRPLCELLQQHVWRQAASGIPPTDILTSVEDDEHATSMLRAKCLLLVSEYIRNVPLELTVQILEDVLNRLDAAGNEANKQNAPSGATHDNPVFATQPSMFAVLAKVQRATDAPVTLPKGGKQPQGSSASAGDAAESAPKKQQQHGRKGEKSAGSSGGAMGAPEALLDLTHYIFWREEDNILYEFRDKRVAALVYRCRPQYDGQPEHEIPLSVLFVLQYGAARQAVDEMKRRQTVNATVERY